MALCGKWQSDIRGRQQAARNSVTYGNKMSCDGMSAGGCLDLSARHCLMAVSAPPLKCCGECHPPASDRLARYSFLISSIETSSPCRITDQTVKPLSLRALECMQMAAAS